MRTISSLKAALAYGAAAVCLCGPAGSVEAQPPSEVSAADERQAEEIVVTARRSGIPVWKVTGPRTSVVLVGDLDGVARGTRWEPGQLAAALRKADRVMYPSAVSVSLPKSAVLEALGYYLRWRGQQTLPKGQSLAGMMPAAQFHRLAALQRRGVLKAGFERKHPFHVAQQLRNYSAREAGRGPSAAAYVRDEVKKLKIDTMPLTAVSGVDVARQLVKTPPAAYVPCLLNMVTLVEGGADAMKARSKAWTDRRVPEILASPIRGAFEACEPEAIGIRARPDVRPMIRRLMSDPRVTLAVLDAETLARPGGVLDDLSAAGFQISGPAWK